MTEQHTPNCSCGKQPINTFNYTSGRRTKYTPNEIRVFSDGSCEIDVYDSFGKYRATGFFSECDLELVQKHKWHLDAVGYLATHTQNGKIRMHRLFLDADGDIDHINENKCDNRRENLRLCSHSYNIGRCSDRKDSDRNASGHRGIVKTRSGTYCVYIDVNGNRKYRNHKTLDAAIQQRLAWEFEAYGTDSPSLRRKEQKEDTHEV